jgi:hypothetical protein
MPYSLPGGYFSALPVNTASIAEGDYLPEVLKGLNNTNPYRVPQGYFESLPEAIVSRVTAPGAKVINGMFKRNIFKYAAAAVITGIVLIAGFFIFENRTGSQQLVSDVTLKEKASQASDEEIISYLQNIPLPATTESSLVVAKPEIKDDAILELLADVTDEELQQYLQIQTGSKTLYN